MPSPVALIGDLLLVAEAQLATPAEELLQGNSLDSDPGLVALVASFDEADSPPSVAEEAGMLGAWVIRHRPFPRDNREIGYRFMRAILKEAKKPWPQRPADIYAIESTVDALEAREISEVEYADWVCLRVAVGESATA